MSRVPLPRVRGSKNRHSAPWLPRADVPVTPVWAPPCWEDVDKLEGHDTAADVCSVLPRGEEGVQGGVTWSNGIGLSREREAKCPLRGDVLGLPSWEKRGELSLGWLKPDWEMQRPDPGGGSGWSHGSSPLWVSRELGSPGFGACPAPRCRDPGHRVEETRGHTLSHPTSPPRQGRPMG